MLKVVVVVEVSPAVQNQSVHEQPPQSLSGHQNRIATSPQSITEETSICTWERSTLVIRESLSYKTKRTKTHQRTNRHLRICKIRQELTPHPSLRRPSKFITCLSNKRSIMAPPSSTGSNRDVVDHGVYDCPPIGPELCPCRQAGTYSRCS